MTTALRRLALAAMVAAGAVVVPSSPARASTSGEALVFASPSSDQVVVLAGGLRTELTAFPTERVLGGHFTSDAGAQAFLYNPGPGPDGLLDVVRDGDELATELRSAPVAGRFDPIVADLDRDGRDDIFWYAPGPARDYVWFFEADGSYTSVEMSAGAGRHQPIPVLIDGWGPTPARQALLLYGRGGQPDRFWVFHGRSVVNRPTSISGDYRVAVGAFYVPHQAASRQQVLFYDPARGTSTMWTYGRGADTGAHRSDTIQASPGLRFVPFVTQAGLHGSDFVYWYGPGPSREQVWDFRSLRTVTVGEGPQIGSTSRVVRDPHGRSAAEEIVLLGEETTARTLQLAPEHAPILGTVTPIPGLPAGQRGAVTWFESPVD